tara:strand:- start:831 stop:1988 length:1158 start_codon:yes stop_codon:yes gene_type:complete
MNLPTDILRNIVSFNNPKLEIMVKDKSRNEVTSNYLCMCNDNPPTRINYTKKHFAKNDIIKVMSGTKFISYGMIIDMLHQPIPNVYGLYQLCGSKWVAKLSNSYKLLYLPLNTEYHFINGVKTIECFKPPFKAKELNLRTYQIENSLKECCNDIFMMNIKLYDVVFCYKNTDTYNRDWCHNSHLKTFTYVGDMAIGMYLVYMGDDIFVSYDDFLRPRYKYLEKLEVSKFKLEYPNTIIQHVVSNKELRQYSNYEDYVERIEWIGLGIEKEAIMNVILETQYDIDKKQEATDKAEHQRQRDISIKRHQDKLLQQEQLKQQKEDAWIKYYNTIHYCPCGGNYKCEIYKDLHEKTNQHKTYVKEERAFYVKLEEQQNETNYLSFDDVV